MKKKTREKILTLLLLPVPTLLFCDIKAFFYWTYLSLPLEDSAAAFVATMLRFFYKYVRISPSLNEMNSLLVKK